MANKKLGPEIAGAALGLGTGAAHGALAARGRHIHWHPLVSGALGTAIAVGGYVMQGKGKSRKQKQTGEYMSAIGQGVAVAAGAVAIKDGVETAMNPFIAARREHERLETRRYWQAKEQIEAGQSTPELEAAVIHYEEQSKEWEEQNKETEKQLTEGNK